MVRTAGTVERIAMAWHDDLSLQFLAARDGRVEVVDFKPQQHAISVWLDVWVSDTTMMMLHIPSVQLKKQPAVRNEPLILRAAMRTLAAKETLIPATARLHIAHANKGLWTHTNLAAWRSAHRWRPLRDSRIVKGHRGAAIR